MKVLSFLIAICFLPPTLTAYTIVLKTGKLVEGKYVGEDQSTIQLKDPSGVYLSVKKVSVDLDATRLRNPIAAEPKPVQPSSLSEQNAKKTIVEIAVENRRRNLNGKAYTKEDLHALPELSLIGSEETSVYESIPASDSVEIPAKAELYWRKEGSTLKKRLESLREKLAGLEETCTQARQTNNTRRSKPHKKAIDLLSVMDEPAACKKQEELLSQLEEAQNRWDDFEIRARRAGVPWSWLE